MKKKSIAIIMALIAVILCVTLAACGGEKKPAETTAAQTTAGTTAADTTAADTTAADTTAADTTAPEIKTFDGYEFSIAGERGNGGNTFFVTAPANALENQLVRAYESLEDELDIVISFVDANYDAVVANAVANKKTADFVHFRHQYYKIGRASCRERV